MKKIRWKMSIGLVGCQREGELEVEDDMSEDEIYEMVWDEAAQRLETSWDYVE